jgi:hypothetical protein
MKMFVVYSALIFFVFFERFEFVSNMKILLNERENEKYFKAKQYIKIV